MFPPVLTQTTTVDMEFMIMQPFLQENSPQAIMGKILLWK